MCQWYNLQLMVPFLIFDAWRTKQYFSFMDPLDFSLESALSGQSYGVIVISIKFLGNIFSFQDVFFNSSNSEHSNVPIKKNPLKVYFISVCIVSKRAFETINKRRQENAYFSFIIDLRLKNNSRLAREWVLKG